MDNQATYQRTKLVITEFDTEDVITTSGEPMPVVTAPNEWGRNGLQIIEK